MTPGPVDLKIVGDRLRSVRLYLGELDRLPAGSLTEFTGDFRNPASAESFLRRAIEALLDTARHLLSRGYGVAPLEYREVARLAGDRALVENVELRTRFVEIAGFRKRLTHYYDEVTVEELFGVLSRDLEDLERIADELSRAASRLASR